MHTSEISIERKPFVPPRHSAGAAIFALVMLFNPNVNLVDILPDFIGYFILARIFEPASDMAPHFEEARRNILRLAYVSLAKIPASLAVSAIRAGNTLDNDIVALSAFVFAVLELIFVIPAVKSTFEALFYLGERTDATSLISGKGLLAPESLYSFTTVFAVLKCILYSLPEMLRLTRSVEIGSTSSMLTGSRYYPPVILLSLVLGSVFGGIWLSRMIKYVRSIKREGRFYGALTELGGGKGLDLYYGRLAVRHINTTFILFTVAAAATVDLIFDNYKQINLLPSFIFGALFLAALLRFSRYADVTPLHRRANAFFGIGYITASVVNYVITFAFLTSHSYSELIGRENEGALEFYRAVEIASIAECAFYIALIICFFFAVKRYIEKKTGIPKGSPEYRDSDARYHGHLTLRAAVLSLLALLIGILDLVNVFAKGNAQLIFSHKNDVTMPTITASALPWLTVVILALNIIYALYSAYFFSGIKNELTEAE